MNGEPMSLVSQEVDSKAEEKTVDSREGSTTVTGNKRNLLNMDEAGMPTQVDADNDDENMEYSSPQFVLPLNVVSPLPEELSNKRRRGRPKGTGKLQSLATIGGSMAELAGGSFDPHVVIVPEGEDVAGKIVSFFRSPPQTVCVLSAIGTLSKVELRPSVPSANNLIFEGCFEIVTLKGQIDKLSILLAKPNGQIFGGIVAGLLIAANPVQLVVATFKQSAVKFSGDSCKHP